MHARSIDVPKDWHRAECHPQVIALIRSHEAPPGIKRAAYLRWLLSAEVPYQPADLDKVITHRPIAAPSAAELR